MKNDVEWKNGFLYVMSTNVSGVDLYIPFVGSEQDMLQLETQSDGGGATKAPAGWCKTSHKVEEPLARAPIGEVEIEKLYIIFLLLPLVRSQTV